MYTDIVEMYTDIVEMYTDIVEITLTLFDCNKHVYMTTPIWNSVRTTTDKALPLGNNPQWSFQNSFHGKGVGGGREGGEGG